MEVSFYLRKPSSLEDRRQLILSSLDAPAGSAIALQLISLFRESLFEMYPFKVEGDIDFSLESCIAFEIYEKLADHTKFRIFNEVSSVLRPDFRKHAATFGNLALCKACQNISTALEITFLCLERMEDPDEQHSSQLLMQIMRTLSFSLRSKNRELTSRIIQAIIHHDKVSIMLSMHEIVHLIMNSSKGMVYHRMLCMDPSRPVPFPGNISGPMSTDTFMMRLARKRVEGVEDQFPFWEFLISRGELDLNLVSRGHTALSRAIESGSWELCRFLARHTSLSTYTTKTSRSTYIHLLVANRAPVDFLEEVIHANAAASGCEVSSKANIAKMEDWLESLDIFQRTAFALALELKCSEHAVVLARASPAIIDVIHTNLCRDHVQSLCRCLMFGDLSTFRAIIQVHRAELVSQIGDRCYEILEHMTPAEDTPEKNAAAAESLKCSLTAWNCVPVFVTTQQCRFNPFHVAAAFGILPQLEVLAEFSSTMQQQELHAIYQGKGYDAWSLCMMNERWNVFKLLIQTKFPRPAEASMASLNIHRFVGFGRVSIRAPDLVNILEMKDADDADFSRHKKLIVRGASQMVLYSALLISIRETKTEVIHAIVAASPISFTPQMKASFIVECFNTGSTELIGEVFRLVKRQECAQEQLLRKFVFGPNWKEKVSASLSAGWELEPGNFVLGHRDVESERDEVLARSLNAIQRALFMKRFNADRMAHCEPRLPDAPMQLSQSFA